MRIAIEPIWRFTWEGDPEPNLSPRHASNLLDKWSAFLAHRWSSLRAGLRSCSPLWALSSCGPPSDCTRDLAHRFRTSLKNSRNRSGNWSLVVKPVLRINASHGFAVAKLRDLLLSEEGLGVDIRYVASQSALVSLAQEGCDLAGMHLPSAT